MRDDNTGPILAVACGVMLGVLGLVGSVVYAVIKVGSK